MSPDEFHPRGNQPLDLSAVVNGAAKTATLENAYKPAAEGGGDLCGCWISRDVEADTDYTNPGGRAARWHRDKFRDDHGRDTHLLTDYWDDLAVDAETENGYVASKDAFATFERDRADDAQDWLFRFFQNSGCCVGASGVLKFHGLLGTRAANPANGESFRYLMAMWAYAFRQYCHAGWYMAAHASVTAKHGYCFALPTIAGYDYGGENDSERLTTNRPWCAQGPSYRIQEHVKKQGWRVEPGAISEFNGGVEGIRRLVQSRGQLHHGSNHTSASSTPNRLKRIGGHAQTMFGADWSEDCLAFFADQGIRYTADDFPCLNHQTWGGGWSGAVSDRFWYPAWGPKPEGAWICSAKQMVKYFSQGYAYLPKFKGLPADNPPPPPPPEDEVNVTGQLHTDSGEAVRGDVVVHLAGKRYRYIWTPAGFVRRLI